MPQGKGDLIKAKKGSALPPPPPSPQPASAAKKVAAQAAPPLIGKKGGAAQQKPASKRPPTPPSEDEEDDEEFDEEGDWTDEEGDDEELDEDEFGDGLEEDDEENIDFDDVDDEEDDDEGDDEESEDDADFEAKAAKFKRQMLEQTRAATQEMAAERANAARSTVLQDAEHLAELEAEAAAEEAAHRDEIGLLKQSSSAEELRDRIKETVRVLSRFKEEREEGRSREEYLALLRHDLIELYEYNDFLMDSILDMFPPHEAVEFLEAMEKPRPTTIRVNTIKAKRRDLVQTLVKRGMNVEALEKWSKVGLQVFESNVPIAGTVEYLAGHYMLQSAVSFLPVMALMPEENERVLDMSAAPGGKTTYIAQLMKNTGVLFANDVSEPRCKSLNANLQRLGVTNTIVTNYDGIDYEKIMKNFNRTLLDAPCTGSGIISRDKSIKTSKTYEDVQRASQLQRRLLLSAIDCTKVGGFIVYSTCSFLVEEDEAVVDYALRRRHVRIVEMGLPFGRPGVTKYRHSRFDPSVAMSRKYFPHVHNMDGFYVCKFEKLADGAIKAEGGDEGEMKPKPRMTAQEKAQRANQRQAVADKAAAAAAAAAPPKTNLSIPPSRFPKRAAAVAAAAAPSLPADASAKAAGAKRKAAAPKGTDALAAKAPRKEAAPPASAAKGATKPAKKERK